MAGAAAFAALGLGGLRIKEGSGRQRCTSAGQRYRVGIRVGVSQRWLKRPAVCRARLRSQALREAGSTAKRGDRENQRVQLFIVPQLSEVEADGRALREMFCLDRLD